MTRDQLCAGITATVPFLVTAPARAHADQPAVLTRLLHWHADLARVDAATFDAARGALGAATLAALWAWLPVAGEA